MRSTPVTTSSADGARSGTTAPTGGSPRGCRTGFSLLPIRALSLTGFGVFFLDAIFAAVLFAHRFIYRPQQEGALWTLFAVLFFFVGLIFLALGLIGEYIGRIYLEVRRRPTYLVRAVYGEAAGDRAFEPQPRR